MSRESVPCPPAFFAEVEAEASARGFSGALGAQFLQTLRKLVENPLSMM